MRRATRIPVAAKAFRREASGNLHLNAREVIAFRSREKSLPSGWDSFAIFRCESRDAAYGNGFRFISVLEPLRPDRQNP